MIINSVLSCYLQMKFLICVQAVAFSTLVVVECNLFQRFQAKVAVEDIVRTIPSSTYVSCILSCKESRICKQAALSDDRACLHLQRNFTSSVDVELLQPVQHPPSIGKGKQIECQWSSAKNSARPPDAEMQVVFKRLAVLFFQIPAL